MTAYQHFIGIDIGKFTFVVATWGDKSTQEYDNTPMGMKNFMKDFKKKLPEAFVVLETTGGYEMALLTALLAKKIAVHRAHTRKVKNFIKSWGNGAKTDALDAKALALYGFERHGRLEIFSSVSNKLLSLYELVQRRYDLKQMLVAEKNRAQAPKTSFTKASCQAMISAILEQIEQVTCQIEQVINSDETLRQRKTILKTIPGIGDKTAEGLITLMPELGNMTRRQAASLAGLAPRAQDSGLHQGYRRTGHGRNGLKPILFMAAMAARRSHSPLKAFYENLISRGKKKMVALTALMRKIIVIANARLKILAQDPSHET